MADVLIVGGGPAGAAAGIVLARAGARVRIVDRAAFPRDKLCGDTVNPGTLARLHALGVGEEVERRGLRVAGMVVTGGRGDSVVGRYPDGRWGRAILRRDLDGILLQAAIAAGCEFEPGLNVRAAVVDEANAVRRVTGVRVSVGGREIALSAPITIAADGRRSALVWGLGLARHPASPRRWAIGAYFANFGPADSFPGFTSDDRPLHVRRASEGEPVTIGMPSHGASV